MKFVSTYQRRLKTSRELAFENIMDLDHVGVVHKRWFSNVRALHRRSDYVEYRLTSHFYGLRQEITAKGGPVDADRYWYEFIGPLARIRVDGLMEGKDGDLTLTETIGYRFPWFLAPFFWALRPVFKQQKKDILLADSRLLEREFHLEQTGFRRLARPARRPRVVVYGGNGFFGRLVVEDLLRFSDAEIVVAGRHIGPRSFHPFESRVCFCQSDINDYESVLATVENAQVAIGCIGPFQGLSVNLLRGCIEKGIHYVDVADDRDFVLRCHELGPKIEQAGVMAFVGCSVVPGMSSLLTQFISERMKGIETIRTFITPGTRHPRGRGSFLCLLDTVGREFSIPYRGQQRTITGWTGRERVFFPPPLGERWVYFVVDIANYYLHPRQFNAKTVEFKIGSEIDLLNRSLAGIRRLKQTMHIHDLNPLTPVFKAIIGLASCLGTTQGAVMVEVSPNQNGAGEAVRMSVFAESHGEIIPAVLPSIATQMILSGELNRSGIVFLYDWITEDRFARELEKRKVHLAIKTSDKDEWRTLTADTNRQVLTAA